ncbi:MAG: hypothetical protein ACP5RV_12465, partial [Thiomonas sp.]
MAKVVDVQAKPADVEVTDALGRVLTLRRPNVLAQYQLVKMLGADVASNQVYLSMVMPLLYLQKIDGEAANFANVREMEAMIQRLDEEKMEALNRGIQENFQSRGD